MQKLYERLWKKAEILRQPYVLPLLGFILAAAGFLPYLLLGKGSVITVNDQLDGEIFTYIFGAAYLGSGEQAIGQWMGGIAREALFPPSLLTVLFYKVLPPFTAFLVNQFLVAVTAYFGMYAFLKRLTEYKWISFAAALLFAYLPFYSVYGLTAAGLPLLAEAVAGLAGRERRGRNLLLVLLYALSSSFVLLGYAVCGLLVLYCGFLLCRKERRQFLFVYLAAGLLILVYGLTNLGLIGQVLGAGTAQVSHKTEYVLHALPPARSFWDMLLNGSGHAPSFHRGILLLVMAALAVCAPVRKRMSGRQRAVCVRILALFLAAVFIAAFYAVFHSGPAVAFRQRLGGFFVYFQLDRIYWFYPFLWYAMFALALELFYSMLRRGAERRGGRIHNRDGHRIRQGNAIGFRNELVIRGLGPVFLVLMCGMAAWNVLWNSDFKKNVRQLLNTASSNAITWEKYYGEDIFEQIAAEIGRPKEEYRVGSVALNPAAAAYNGFYTVDGYSNNYALSYKHAFRKVIAGELAKDEVLRRYYDDWGNRCYLFTAQLKQQYYFEKDSGEVLSGISWDMEALRELGCEYLFSGMEIVDAERMGITLAGSFESEKTDCRYRIWVYELVGKGGNADEKETPG